MEALLKSLAAGLAVLAGEWCSLSEAPAPARPAEVELVSASDQCAGVTLEEAPGRGLSLKFPSLAAETSAAEARAHKFCHIQFDVKAPEGCCVRRAHFEVSGSADIAPGSRGSNVSVRYFAHGESGDAYYRSLDPESGSGDITGASEGAPVQPVCEQQARLNLIVDVTANAAADDPARPSSVEITEIKLPTLLEGPQCRAAPSAS